MKIKVILNPYANRWRAGARKDEVQAAFAAAGLTADVVQTQKPQEGIALAETAVADGYRFGLRDKGHYR